MSDVLVSDARVVGVEVTLLAVRVGTKQMTQAVFRQLVQTNVSISAVASGEQVLWGFVNEHDGKGGCLVHRSHLHVLVQEGANLRKAVERPIDDGADKQLLRGDELPERYYRSQGWSESDIEEWKDHVIAWDQFWNTRLSRLEQIFIAI